jgi:isopenicillin N synthase-like dioxygenase
MLSQIRSHARLFSRRFHSSFTGIPTVDIGALVDGGNAKDKQAVGDALHDACVNVGFFYVQNHGAFNNFPCSSANAQRIPLKY